MSKLRKPLLSNYIRQQRYNMIQPYVSGSVLDVGCGQGYLLDAIPSIKHYVGIDNHPLFLEQAKTRYPKHEFYQIDLEYEIIPEPLQNQQFQTIIMLAILEHLTNPKPILQQLKPLLSNNGIIIITTPTPVGHKVHDFGSRLGLFYREAADDHKSIWNKQQIDSICKHTSLKQSIHQTFQFGCNQLSVIHNHLSVKIEC